MMDRIQASRDLFPYDEVNRAVPKAHLNQWEEVSCQQR
jgi:hypothetical protein